MLSTGARKIIFDTFIRNGVNHMGGWGSVTFWALGRGFEVKSVLVPWRLSDKASGGGLECVRKTKLEDEIRNFSGIYRSPYGRNGPKRLRMSE